MSIPWELLKRVFILFYLITNSLIKPVSTILAKRSTIAIWYAIGKRNPTVNTVVKDSQS